jgi:hypothetical protein
MSVFQNMLENLPVLAYIIAHTEKSSLYPVVMQHLQHIGSGFRDRPVIESQIGRPVACRNLAEKIPGAENPVKPWRTDIGEALERRHNLSLGRFKGTQNTDYFVHLPGRPGLPEDHGPPETGRARTE